jgi:hypothetical protein
MYQMKKKSLFLNLTWAVLALVLAFTGCEGLLDNLTDLDGDKTATAADKINLGADIAAAEDALGTVTVSDNAASVPLGTQWVTAAEKAALQTAITVAQSTYNSSSATKAQVDQAASSLLSASTAFQLAKKSGTMASVNTAALSAKITDAKNAKDSVTIAASAGNVAEGEPWATQGQVDTLSAAITAAEAVRNDTGATQTTVSDAVNTLNTAITDFNTAVAGNGEGTKNSGFTEDELDALKTRANTAKAEVTASANGDDVPPAGTWVTHAALNDLNNAIDAAATLSDQNYLALSSALKTFNAAKKPGSTPDITALNAAITDADDAKKGEIVAASADEVLSGSPWVKRAQSDALQAVYAASLATANKQDATKAEVDAAISALDDAVTAYEAAKTANGPGTKTATEDPNTDEPGKSETPGGNTNEQGDDPKEEPVTGQNQITITGLRSVYDDGTEVQLALTAVKPANTSEDLAMVSYGMGTVTGGSLTVLLYEGNEATSWEDETSTSREYEATASAPWMGSGSYYVAFVAENDIFVFLSKQQVTFSGAAVRKAYTDFDLLVYSMKLGDYDIESSITLDEFIGGITAAMQMPGGPYTYETWKGAMKAMVEAEMVEAQIVPVAKISLDYTLYKDEACTQPFKGTDLLTPETVAYCKAPFFTGSSSEDSGEEYPGVSAYTVSGRITNSDGSGAEGAEVLIAGEIYKNLIIAGTDGYYTITGVLAGTGYYIDARLPMPDGTTSSAYSIIDVSGDVSGIDLQLEPQSDYPPYDPGYPIDPNAPTYTVSGRITYSDGSGAVVSPIEIGYDVGEGQFIFLPLAGGQNADGSYSVTGVPAGTCFVQATLYTSEGVYSAVSAPFEVSGDVSGKDLILELVRPYEPGTSNGDGGGNSEPPILFM